MSSKDQLFIQNCFEGLCLLGLLCAFYHVAPPSPPRYHNTQSALKGWQCNAGALAETPAVVVGGRRRAFREKVWRMGKVKGHSCTQANNHGFIDTRQNFKLLCKFQECNSRHRGLLQTVSLKYFFLNSTCIKWHRTFSVERLSFNELEIFFHWNTTLFHLFKE